MEYCLKIFILISVVTVAIGVKKKFELTPRILGGQFYYQHEHPYLVSLRRYNKSALGSTQHFCGGAILNKRWIITSAHCTSNEMLPDASDLLIAVGKHSYQSESGIKEMYRAEEIVVHPNHTGGNAYDLSLIKTQNNIEFNPHTQPIKISMKLIGSGIGALLSGWGLTDHLQEAVYSKTVYLTTLTNDACITKLGSNKNAFVDQSVLCANNPGFEYGVGLCHGDSGTPLIQGPITNKEGPYSLIGIAIWNVPRSAPCAIGYPDQFTRISHYLSWIKKHVHVSIL